MAPFTLSSLFSYKLDQYFFNFVTIHFPFCFLYIGKSNFCHASHPFIFWFHIYFFHKQIITKANRRLLAQLHRNFTFSLSPRGRFHSPFNINPVFQVSFGTLFTDCSEKNEQTKLRKQKICQCKKTKGLAACNAQTTSPFRYLNEFKFEYCLTF